MIDVNKNSQNTILSRKLMTEKSIFNSLVLQNKSKQIDKPKGKLLPAQDPITALATGTLDIAKDTKNLTDALTKGKSNDHELGRMNNLGLKIGGLSIASYLLTRRTTQASKLMELAGFGTFFSMMALWPKLFIELPLKARFGFNVGQKYEDSQGRKKEFFQDNQYQPWDLWSDKQINKVADRMGVDKDMKDREEFTKKKMQKVALQARTSWMLSAGLATPLLASMVAGYIEKQAQPLIIKKQLDKSKTALLAINADSLKIAEKADFDEKNLKGLKELLAKYKGIAPDADFYSEAAQLINPSYTLVDKADKDALKILDQMKPSTIDSTLIKDMEAAFKPSGSALSLDEITKNLTEIFKDGVDVTDAFGDSVKVGASEIEELLKNCADATPETIKKELSNRFTPVDKTIADKVEAALKTEVDLEAGYKRVEDLYSASKATKAKFKVFENFVNSLAGSKAESFYTQVFKGISAEFMKGLCPSFADLNAARKSPDSAYEIASRIIKNIAEGAGPTGGRGAHENFLRTYGEKVDEICKQDDKVFKGKLKLLDKITADEAKYLGLREFNETFASVSEQVINLSKTSLDNSALRPIMALDAERRLKNANLESEVGDVVRYLIHRTTPTLLVDKCGYQNKPKIFEQAVNFLFGEELDSSVVNALKSKNPETTIVDRLRTARRVMKDIYLNANSDDISKYAPESVKMGVASAKVRHAIIGEPISEFFLKSAKSAYNNKLWMRIFGGATVGVIAITLASQAFFGRMKAEEKLYLEKGGNNATK